jgi:hypothetical protein
MMTKKLYAHFADAIHKIFLFQLQLLGSGFEMEKVI